MPSTRPSRLKVNNSSGVQHYADPGSSGDTDHEEPTPKPPFRTMSKKRLSEVYNPDDGNYSSDTARVPLKSVNINDDAAEKRRRRRSAKNTIELENAEAGPSSGVHGADGSLDGPRGTGQARTAQQLQAVDQIPAVTVPLDVMSSNFEEWMKMATDNVREEHDSHTNAETSPEN